MFGPPPLIPSWDPPMSSTVLLCPIHSLVLLSLSVIPSIFTSIFLWATSNFFFTSLLILHVSLPYVIDGNTIWFIIFLFRQRGMFYSNISLRLDYAAQPCPILQLISFSMFPSKVINCPKYTYIPQLLLFFLLLFQLVVSDSVSYTSPCSYSSSVLSFAFLIQICHHLLQLRCLLANITMSSVNPRWLIFCPFTEIP